MRKPNHEIYVIRMERDYKIGYSVSPMERLNKLQTGSPVKLEMVYRGPGTRKDEKEIHRLLKEWRESGEWFSLPDWVVDAIRTVRWRDARAPLAGKIAITLLLGEPREKPKERPEERSIGQPTRCDQCGIVMRCKHDDKKGFYLFCANEKCNSTIEITF